MEQIYMSVNAIPLNVARKIFEIFLGIDFLCENYFVAQVIVALAQTICRVFAVYQYYIIYTLTRIRNTFYLCHTCLHALWLDNILLRQYSGSGSRTDLENFTH